MTYLVINQTNYGDGMYPLGTFRSKEVAWSIANQLEDNIGNEEGDGWTVLEIESYDKYTPESIVATALQQRKHDRLKANGCVDSKGYEYHKAILDGRCVDCGEAIE